MQLTISKTQKDAKQLLYRKIKRFFRHIKFHAQIKDQHLVRVEVKIEKLNLVHWLLQQSHSVKTYWKDRQRSFEMAGVGQADVVSGEAAAEDSGKLFQRLARYLRSKYPRLRYYGGMRFSLGSPADAHWRRFGKYRFVVPFFEIYSDDQATYFACNFMLHPFRSYQKQLETILSELNRISWEDGPVSPELPEIVSRRDCPDRSGWNKNVSLALSSFDRGEVEKVVLARKTEFSFTSLLNPVELLRRLQETDASAFYFCFQPFHNYAFLGGTPERLYQRQQREIFSEAIAGTRPRGRCVEEDERLEDDLLASEKDLREHRFVIEGVRRSLEQLCSHIFEHKDIFVLKLAKLQHLYARLRGTLKKDIDDSQILTRLHPTPAVGGHPKEPALREILDLEPFDRGWYAGPVGWFGKDSAEFAVAIRSGLAVEDKLFLYSGAGIVPGSQPDTEWEEIESKIANFLKALQDY